jgi:hypothetical protein
MIRSLKNAGLYGITFHVDAHQNRPGWEGSSEIALNKLRQDLSEMVFDEGGLSCSFNVTVFPDTLNQVKNIVEWGIRNIKKVHIITFIPVRMVSPDDTNEYLIGDQKIDINTTPYVSKVPYKNLSSTDIYQEILHVLPHYKFCAYLGGSALPTSLKWTLGTHIGTKHKSFGNLGSKTMEFLQFTSHLTRGRYLSYTKPSGYFTGRLVFLFSFFDKEIRTALKRYFKSVLKNPSLLFRKIYLQSISAVQPVDILPTGEQDNCDGCPNKTFWNNRLVSACRFEEYKIWGGPINIIPSKSK